jgi:hypothetical protein
MGLAALNTCFSITRLAFCPFPTSSNTSIKIEAAQICGTFTDPESEFKLLSWKDVRQITTPFYGTYKAAVSP